MSNEREIDPAIRNQYIASRPLGYTSRSWRSIAQELDPFTRGFSGGTYTAMNSTSHDTGLLGEPEELTRGVNREPSEHDVRVMAALEEHGYTLSLDECGESRGSVLCCLRGPRGHFTFPMKCANHVGGLLRRYVLPSALEQFAVIAALRLGRPYLPTISNTTSKAWVAYMQSQLAAVIDAEVVSDVAAAVLLTPDVCLFNATLQSYKQPQGQVSWTVETGPVL